MGTHKWSHARMSTKSESTNRTSKSAVLVSGIKKAFSGLFELASIEVVTGLAITVTLSLLLLNYGRPRVLRLEAGSVAPADIIAPADLKVENTAETQRQQLLAASNILPVFDFVPRASRDARNTIEKTFSIGRSGTPGMNDEELIKAITQGGGAILDKEQLRVLMKHRFNTEMERLMVGHLDSVSANGVVSSRSELTKVGGLGIVRRGPGGDNEITLTDLSTIRDLVTAHALLRSDKLVFPTGYSKNDRRALGEILGSLIVPNLTYKEDVTDSRKKAAINGVPRVMISVDKGKPIVIRGQTVSPVEAELLKAASRYHPVIKDALELAGTLIIVILLLLVLWQYMVRYQHRHLRVRRHFLLQATAFIIGLGLTRVFFTLAGVISQWADRAPFNLPQGYRYLAPLAAGSVLVTLLTDAQAAFVFSAILTVFVGILSGNVHMAAYTLISSVGAIYHLKGCRDRVSLIRAGVWIGLLNAAAAISLDFLGANELEFWALLFDLSCAWIGGVLATMVAFAFLPVYEWAFEITTDIKLLELSNLNLPLLKKLAEDAPGTYHHSIMVGLLAESASEAIGADALFARVACYYHDIGKVVRPTYFVENQSYMENRHDKLSPKMSSIVLANHVKQGIELARQYKLPSRIISIIPEHHGTGLMKFFYYKAREEAGEGDNAALEREFRYPGPKPQTREAAIIMISDSVEAAARTVKDPTPSRLRNMIDTIISRITGDGQLDECNITLRELSIIAESLVKTVSGIHHHRVAYPGYDFNRPKDHTTVEETDSAAGISPAAETPFRRQRGGDSGSLARGVRGARGD